MKTDLTTTAAALLQTLQKVLPDLPEDRRQRVVEEIKIEATKNPLVEDTWIYRLVVIALGACALLSIVFSFWLVMSKSTSGGTEVKVPEIMLALGSASVGALAGLLAPSPANRSQN